MADDPDAVVARLQAWLARPDCPCRGMVAAMQRVVDLRVRPEQRHLWSPALGLQIEEDEQGTVIHGLIGPEPGVWTCIAFSYVALATGLLFLLTFGFVQLSLGQTAWAFWLAAVLAALTATVWFVARAGQRLAAPQTAELRHVVEDALGLSAAEHARTDEDPYHP